jgi:nitrogen regulatory protein PII-like uncharacterized protein
MFYWRTSLASELQLKIPNKPEQLSFNMKVFHTYTDVSASTAAYCTVLTEATVECLQLVEERKSSLSYSIIESTVEETLDT